MKLQENKLYKSLEGKEYFVEKLLGDGGQGEVYSVTTNGRKYALKIYKEEQSSDFIYNLKKNIEMGAPSKAFLWPLEYVTFDSTTYGYLMDIRPSNFVSFVAYLNNKKTFKNQEMVVRWSIEMCKAFKKLHELGCSYQDLNDGSFFFDPDTADILICDNDNVTADKKNLGILGKMRYMAPEIVRGDQNEDGEMQMPDTHSDRFSLGVILFMTLCLGNPLEGEALKQFDFSGEESDRYLFGTNPVFVYDKENTSNRPIRGYHTAVLYRWPKLPTYIQEAFQKTFTEGLKDRENGRTTEIEWIRALTKYRDELMNCPSCGRQFIYGLWENSPTTNCPYCNASKKDVCYLQIGKHNIVLEPGKHLYQFHFDKYSSEYNEEVANVITSKKNPSNWGIRLFLTGDVFLKDSVGNVKTISGDGVIPIIRGLKIKFSDETVGMIH